MARPTPDVSDGELAVMQVLWDRGISSIRQVTDLVFPKGSAVHYATVQKQLERLESKGFVSRDRSLYVHRFSAAVPRDELIGRRVRAVVDKLCGGSLVPLLSHLAHAPELTDAERKLLRDLIRRRNDPAPKPSR
jgi:BlaI family penicillinase repressor